MSLGWMALPCLWVEAGEGAMEMGRASGGGAVAQEGAKGGVCLRGWDGGHLIGPAR